MDRKVAFDAAPRRESHKPGATDKQKYAAKVVPAKRAGIAHPNKIGPKAYKKGPRANNYTAKDTKFSGSLRKYSREYVGPTGGRLLDESLGRSKFQRRFDPSGELTKRAHTGSITGSASFFPSRDKPYTAGFGNHPSSARVAA